MEHHPVTNRPYLCITISTDRPTLHQSKKTIFGYRQKWRHPQNNFLIYLCHQNQLQNTTCYIGELTFFSRLAASMPDQRKLSLVNQEIDRSKVSTPKVKRSPLNHGTLEPFKNHNQMESKTLWLDVRVWTPHLLSWEVTPLFLKPKVERNCYPSNP